jgi:hypothetical protein
LISIKYCRGVPLNSAKTNQPQQKHTERES